MPRRPTVSTSPIRCSGTFETIDGKMGGLAVNTGARVAGWRNPPRSSTVKDLVASSGREFEDAREHVPKGIPEGWRLFRVARVM